MKTCSKCNEVKEPEAFPKKKIQCKACLSEKSRKYRENNPDKVKAYSLKYRENNPDKLKAQSLKYREANRDKTRAVVAKWQKENPDKARAAASKWQKENPDKARAIPVKWRKELRDGYLISRLKVQGFSKDQITPEIIEIKRILIKTKRLCKTLNS